MTRLYTSRPSASVPNQYISDDGRRRLIGETACGSTVPSHGASAAAAIISSRIPAPTIAVGCRRKASRNRFQVGETDFGTAIAGTAIELMRRAARPPEG